MASFTAVARAAAGEASGQDASCFAERRARARRLRDAAIATVCDEATLLCGATVATLAVLAACLLQEGATAAWPWSAGAVAVAACAISAWRRMRRRPRRAVDTRHAHRWLLRLGGPVLGLVLLAPWMLPAAAAPAPRQAVALAVAAYALVGAAVLAPLRATALATALLPLSPATGDLLHAVSTAPALGPACTAAAAAAMLLAGLLHRRWLAAAHRLLALEDRLREAEAARDAALRSDREKSRFLAAASHDLRQPVHALGLFAAALARRLQGTPEDAMVRSLSRAIDDLDRSFNVMLDISRLDAGAVEVRMQRFALRDLFRRLHMHYAGQAEQKGLGLRFSPGGRSVTSDPQLLERVLGNLIQNAIRYTRRGGIVVVARQARGHVHIEVWDSGVGIGATDLPRVFDEFYQVGRGGRGARARSQGLGMGLAIVKRLVRLLGHELVVASRPDRGTMFRLRMAQGELPGMEDATTAADTLPMPTLQPRTVLVVDDEEPIREGLVLLLEEWGYDAIAAGSVAEAEQALDDLDAPPDAVVCDLHLGDGVDGIALVAALRRRCGRDVPAVLVTGDTSPEEMRRIGASGLPALFKPVQPRTLYDALRGLDA